MGTLAVMQKKYIMKFKIFTKSHKFYWTNNNIIYSIMFFCLFVVFINNGTGIIKRNLINNISLIIFFIALITGAILKFIGFSKYELLKGKLDGFLIFEMNSIQIDNEIFTLNKIRFIEITNDDYYGKLTGYSKGNFDGALSNGVNNHIKIILNSGEIIWRNYELCNANDFLEIRSELINYYRKGKMELDNLANVLGESSYDEIPELHNELQKSKHNR